MTGGTENEEEKIQMEEEKIMQGYLLSFIYTAAMPTSLAVFPRVWL